MVMLAMENSGGAHSLTPVTMLVGIGVSILVVVFFRLSGRLRLRGRYESQVNRAMVGGPEITQLSATTREEAIAELAAHAARILRWPDEATIRRNVLRREAQMSTGLVHGIAIPHARFVGLGRSLVLFAKTSTPIEWETADGQPVRMVFFLLTPEEDEDAQLKMLAEIGRCADDPDCRGILQEASDCRDVSRAILRANRDSHR